MNNDNNKSNISGRGILWTIGIVILIFLWWFNSCNSCTDSKPASFNCHTWATLAAYLEIPKETIAAALGHGKKDVTDIYISFDQNKIDEANRRVIDYLNKN